MSIQSSPSAHKTCIKTDYTQNYKTKGFCKSRASGEMYTINHLNEKRRKRSQNITCYKTLQTKPKDIR